MWNKCKRQLCNSLYRVVPRGSKLADSKSVKSSICLALLFAGSSVVCAAEIGLNYNFTGTQFVQLGTSVPGPIPTITGSFSGSFTPGSGIGTNPSTLTSVNLSIGGFVYTLPLVGLQVDAGVTLPGNNYDAFITLGALNNGLLSIGSGDDFLFQFRDFGNGSGSVPGAFYYRAAGGLSYNGTLNFSRASAPVPDGGSTLTLLVLGIATVLSLRRYSKRA